MVTRYNPGFEHGSGMYDGDRYPTMKTDQREGQYVKLKDYNVVAAQLDRAMKKLAKINQEKREAEFNRVVTWIPPK